MIRNLDDSKQVEDYQKQGVTVIKGSGRLAGSGQVEAKVRSLQAEHIIIASVLNDDFRLRPDVRSDPVGPLKRRRGRALESAAGYVLSAVEASVLSSKTCAREGSVTSLARRNPAVSKTAVNCSFVRSRPDPVKTSISRSEARSAQLSCSEPGLRTFSITRTFAPAGIALFTLPKIRA